MLASNKYEIADYLSITEFNNFIFDTIKHDKSKRIEYFKMQARLVGADYIYCLKSELEDKLVPFIYIYDNRGDLKENRNLAEINKKIWTIGEVPVAIVIFSDEIKIIDTRKPIKKEDEANIYIAVESITEELKSKLFYGRLLEESKTDYVNLSPYQILLKHIELNILKKQIEIGCEIGLLKKLVVKFILIKYLEEQTDENGENVFHKDYFSQFRYILPIKDSNFCDVLRDGNIVALLENLDNKFNGGIFKLKNSDEKEEVSKADFARVANALDGDIEIDNQISIWRKYDFNLLPIEFISRLYEQFVISGNNQKEYGAYYTPPHLARLLVDEVLPFDKQINFSNFKILDPSCGSGIFLVLAYKRLITLWMLANKKQAIKGTVDIDAIQRILSNCIYGIDINSDALAITATSLQIELTSHIQPKEIWENLKFKDLEAQGNLQEVGFFKWVKSQNYLFNIIIGNPPFNIGDEVNKENITSGKDYDFTKLKYSDSKNKLKDFPYKNPALAIFYLCLKDLLSSEGELFMVMPAASFLYIPTSNHFRKTVFEHWNISKIYDFTPLIDHLWGKTKIATIAIKASINTHEKNNINHFVVRNTISNEKGSVAFQIDKYDKFSIPQLQASQNNYPWKLHLFGGGKLGSVINKYKSEYISIKEFFKFNNYNYSTGLRKDKSSPNQIDIKGDKILISDKFRNDFIDKECTHIETESNSFRNISDEVSEQPNIFIRLNLNYSLPIVYNTQNIHFFPGVLGIKGDNMKLFVETFKKNRTFYKTLIKLSSSKAYIQQPGSFTIDTQDILKLPIRTDEFNNPIPFHSGSEIEKAVFDDAELIAESLNKINGGINRPVKLGELSQFEIAFCEILNTVYETNEFKFRLIRRIISNNYIWITFKHTNQNIPIEEVLSKQNKDSFKKILIDELTNRGLSINQIITYYKDKNCISFIKPTKLKYWTRSIAYRDAENVKADLFKKGY